MNRTKTKLKILDHILDKGLDGLVIEIIGRRGVEKTNFLSLICSMVALKDVNILYIEGSANFRPELIKLLIENAEMYQNKSADPYLKNIRYQRVYNIDQTENILRKSEFLKIDCIIIDDIFSLFCSNFEESRSRVRKILREMATIAISKKKLIIFTNPIVDKTINNYQKIKYEMFYHDIIRYIHLKISLHLCNLPDDILDYDIVYPKNIRKFNESNYLEN